MTLRRINSILTFLQWISDVFVVFGFDLSCFLNDLQDSHLQQPLYRCEWTLQRNLTRRRNAEDGRMTTKVSLDLWNDSATTSTKKMMNIILSVPSNLFEIGSELVGWQLRFFEGVHLGNGKFYAWALGVKFTSDMKLVHWSWRWTFHVCQDNVIISSDKHIIWKYCTRNWDETRLL